MFGLRKKLAEPAATVGSRQRSSSSDNFNVLAGLGIDIHAFEGNHMDQDDDAELEAELLKLQEGLESTSPSSRSNRKNDDTELSKSLKDAQNEVNFDNIDFTDEDLNDAELMAELKKLESGKEVSKARSSQPLTFDQQHPTVTEAVKPLVPGRITIDSSTPAKQTQIIPSAYSSMTDQNEFERADIHKTTGGTRVDSHITQSVASLQPSVVLLRPEKEVARTQQYTPINITEENKIKSIGYNKKDILLLLSKRQASYRTSAVQAKRQGNQDLAISLLRIYKTLVAMSEHVEQDLPIDATAIPEAPSTMMTNALQRKATAKHEPSGSTQHTGPAMDASRKMKDLEEWKQLQQRPTVNPPPQSHSEATQHNTQTAPGRVDQTKDTQNLSKDVVKQFEKQVTQCTEYVQIYTREGNKDRAAHFLKLKKQFENDLSTIRVASSRGQIVKFKQLDEKVIGKRKFFDLKPTEMELYISGCSNLPKEAVDYNAFLTWSINFPSAESPQNGTAPSCDNSPHPKMDFSAMITIDRRKTFLRFAQRRSVDITLMYKSFFRKIVVGIARVPLIDLFKKNEMSYKAEFMDSNRRPIGAYVFARLRTSSPLEGDAAAEPDKIVKFLSIASVDSPSASVKPAISSRATPSVKALASDSITSRGLEETMDDESDDEGDPDDPSSVMKCVSNDVLEWMVRQCDGKIAEYKRKGLKPDDMIDRKQQAQLAIDLLVYQLNGALSPEEYLERLRKQVASEKALALRLKRKGKLDWAMQAMTRAKIMMEELRSVNPNELEIKAEAMPAVNVTLPTDNHTSTSTDNHKRISIPLTTSMRPVAEPGNSTNSLEDDTYDGDPDNVMEYVSHEVLQWVLDECDKAINLCKAEGRPVPGELLDRKEQANMRQEMIGLEVTMGTLTPHRYKTLLIESITREETLAVRLKRANNIEWAKLALARANIMEIEVSEISDVMI